MLKQPTEWDKAYMGLQKSDPVPQDPEDWRVWEAVGVIVAVACLSLLGLWLGDKLACLTAVVCV